MKKKISNYLKGRNFGGNFIWRPANFDIFVKLGGNLFWWFL